MRHPGAKTVVEGSCDYHSKTSLDYKTFAWLKLCSFTLIFSFHPPKAAASIHGKSTKLQ